MMRKIATHILAIVTIFLTGVILAEKTTAQQVWSPYTSNVNPNVGPQIHPPVDPDYHFPRSAVDAHRSYYDQTDPVYVWGHPDDGAPSEAPYIRAQRWPRH